MISVAGWLGRGDRVNDTRVIVVSLETWLGYGTEQQRTDRGTVIRVRRKTRYSQLGLGLRNRARPLITPLVISLPRPPPEAEG